MRARWPLVYLLIGIIFASIMLLMESVGRRGGWWPEGLLRQLPLSLSVGAVIVLLLGVALMVVRRVGGRAS